MLVSYLVLFAQLSQTAQARQAIVQQRVITPALSFPEAGLDDAAAYQGYQTRLYRDAASNTVQIYLDRREGRVVHILADAENASVGFSARLAGGGAAALEWDAPTATVAQTGRHRSIVYAVRSEAASIALGWFVLGSMRVERDFLHGGDHRRPFASPAFAVEELVRLVNAIEQLPAAERQRHLRALNATSVTRLRARLRPTVTIDQGPRLWRARVVQPSLDGRDTMSIALVVDPRRVRGVAAGDSLVLSAVDGGGVRVEVQLSTTGATLAPLARGEIFTPDFLAFLDSVRAAGSRDADAQVRARWMERQVRGVELLASREKLMAGLPTYATYFGRDMLVTTLMMRGIWRDDMSAFAIAAALRKLSPDGQVSHEEALGAQAVREAAAEYAALLRARDEARGRGNVRAADSLLARAHDVLRRHRRVRENYHMIDDELQLPVLVASWIADPNVSASRKRAFLREVDGGNEPRLTRLLRELALVARMTAPYAASPSVETLIAFAPRAEGGWASTSWRDSGAGYAGGRYGMDVNAIWAPHALQGLRTILRTIPTLGFSIDSLASATPTELGNTPLGAWTRDSTSLARAIDTWMGAGRHFVVRLGPDDVRAKVAQRMEAMPEVERAHWQGVLAASGADRDSLVFLALSLDAGGAPIGVVNTDIATRLFLGDPLHGAIDPAVVVRDSRLFVRPYPVGLFVERVGPVVANDAFATDSVWGAFVRDPYHGPRVAWGREVNLFLLGVAQQVLAAGGGDSPFTRELRAAAERVVAAVDASGFRSELWSYAFEGGIPTPVRYGSGGDVQLWSTTDLAVQYVRARLRW